MCGIAGYWNHRSGAPGTRPAIRRMLAALHHRGPDESGYAMVESGAIGTARLSVIDPAQGKQPMTNGLLRHVSDDTPVAGVAIQRLHSLRSRLQLVQRQLALEAFQGHFQNLRIEQRVACHHEFVDRYGRHLRLPS
jgi:glutamine phosphoribosylpyrophosphate amidotransferase